MTDPLRRKPKFGVDRVILLCLNPECGWEADLGGEVDPGVGYVMRRHARSHHASPFHLKDGRGWAFVVVIKA